MMFATIWARPAPAAWRTARALLAGEVSMALACRVAPLTASVMAWSCLPTDARAACLSAAEDFLLRVAEVASMVDRVSHTVVVAVLSRR